MATLFGAIAIGAGLIFAAGLIAAKVRYPRLDRDE